MPQRGGAAPAAGGAGPTGVNHPTITGRFTAAMYAERQAEATPATIPAAGRRPTRRLAWDRLVPSWPLLVGLLVFARLLAARLALLNDPDTYLHIAAGRWILAHGALPVHDPFSHSMPGASWISSEWLAQVVLAATYDGLGWGGVIVLSAACTALAAGLLLRFLLRHVPPLPALVAAVAALALLQPHVLARPHILALPLLVLWSGWLLAARDAARPPPFAALPLLALWANLHGSFLFGLALAGFLGAEAVLRAGDRSRRDAALQWGGFLVAATLAALLTPHAVAGLVQPIRLVAMPALQASFGEWLSPDFQQSPALELWVLGLVLIGFASGARLPAMRLVLLLGLLHMSLQHVRHADLLAIVGPLAVAAPLGPVLAALTTGQSPSSITGWFAHLARPERGPALALSLALAGLLASPLALLPITRGDDAVTPQAALAAARHQGLSGPVLNSEPFGGYLVFRGVPSFIDGRAEMYGNEFLARDVAAERGDATVLRELLARYRIAWTLLAPQSAAVAALDNLPGWERVYADRYAVIHRRAAAP